MEPYSGNGEEHGVGSRLPPENLLGEYHQETCGLGTARKVMEKRQHDQQRHGALLQTNRKALFQAGVDRLGGLDREKADPQHGERNDGGEK